MTIKFLILLFGGYYIYRYMLKPMLPKFEQKEEEEQPKVRFTKKEPQKQVDESDYIDYEEVD